MKLLADIMKRDSSAGLLLIFVTILALILKNSDFSVHYNDFLHTL